MEDPKRCESCGCEEIIESRNDELEQALNEAPPRVFVCNRCGHETPAEA